MKFEFPKFGWKKDNPESKSDHTGNQQEIERTTAEFAEKLRALASLSWKDLENPETPQILKDVPITPGMQFFYKAMKVEENQQNLKTATKMLLEYLGNGQNEEVLKEAWKVAHSWLSQGSYVWRTFPEDVTSLVRASDGYTVVPAEETFEEARKVAQVLFRSSSQLTEESQPSGHSESHEGDLVQSGEETEIDPAAVLESEAPVPTDGSSEDPNTKLPDAGSDERQEVPSHESDSSDNELAPARELLKGIPDEPSELYDLPELSLADVKETDVIEVATEVVNGLADTFMMQIVTDANGKRKLRVHMSSSTTIPAGTVLSEYGPVIKKGQEFKLGEHWTHPIRVITLNYDHFS